MTPPITNSSESIESSSLVDWACIDLIQRRRRGEVAQVEDYINSHPRLQADNAVLDLIDAEICVRRELGEHLNAPEWIGRFPEQVDAINQLLDMDEVLQQLSVANRESAGRVTIGNPDAATCQIPEKRGTDSQVTWQFSELGTEISSFESNVRCDEIVGEMLIGSFRLPLAPPSHYVLDEAIYCSPISRLIRCRDSKRSGHYVFQVKSVGIGRSPGSRPLRRRGAILDAHEKWASLRHPHWIVPESATSDGVWVGVIRRWVHGISFSEAVRFQSATDLCRRLAEAAYALEFAHRSGMTHGAIHGGNLFVTHDATIVWTDPDPLPRAVEPPDANMRADALQFVQLVAAVEIKFESTTFELASQCVQIARAPHSDRLARMGELLMNAAERSQPSLDSHRGSLSHVIKRNAKQLADVLRKLNPRRQAQHPSSIDHENSVS